MKDATKLRASLRELMVLRGIAVCGQTAAVAISAALGVDLPWVPMGFLIGTLVVLEVATWIRLRQGVLVTPLEVTAHLFYDLAVFTSLVYLSGGASNPFSLLYVLHAVLMALLLGPLAATAGTLVIVACYVALNFEYRPLEMTSGAPLSVSLRMFGMQVSLALTAAFTAWFVRRIVLAVRAYERLVTDAAQQALRDDTVLRAGTLAAGAAHELARPLSTMAVLAKEIEANASSSTREDAARLRSQIDECRATIADLMSAAGHAEPASGGPERLDAFLESIAEASRRVRPEAVVRCDWNAIATPPTIFGDHGLRQALVALVNNAVDASPEDVRLVGAVEADVLRVAIIDRGPGIRDEDMAKLGRRVFSTKPRGSGAGLGVVLAWRTIERLGGNLHFASVPEGGTRVDITLPLARLYIHGEP